MDIKSTKIDLKGFSPVADFEGFYVINECGIIFSLTNGKQYAKIYKPNKNAYRSVFLRKDGKIHNRVIHVLVAKAFIPNPNNYPFVNHIDGDKSNCHVSNLEWCTSELNAKHAIKIGLMRSTYKLPVVTENMKIGDSMFVKVPRNNVIAFVYSRRKIKSPKYFEYKKHKDGYVLTYIR